VNLWPRREADLDPDLLDRLLAGEMLAGDAARVTAWVGDDVQRAWVIDLLHVNAADARAAATENAGAPSPASPTPKWDSAPIRAVMSRRHGTRLNATVQPPAALAVIPPDRRAKVRKRIIVASTAIVVAVILAVSIAWAVPMIRSGALIPSRQYETSGGQRETVLLPDGSQFTLAPSSRLRLSFFYGRNRREVTVDGEGYFSVVRDQAHPFVVHAANAELIAGNTASFDVRLFPGDSVVTIAMAEGQAILASVALAPGDFATISPANTIVVAPHSDVAERTAWTSGRLEYHDVPLEEVLVELSRWYDMTLRVTDSALAVTPVTATYDNLSATDALASLANAVGARTTHVGRATVFVPAH
jgi:transmembrane sensor